MTARPLSEADRNSRSASTPRSGGKTGDRAFLLVLVVIVLTTLATEPALAHRFNVALVVPHSPEGRQIHEGFMLATKERDRHPDQVSDGHLGGLDVYVTVIDGNSNTSAEIERMADEGKAEIWVAFGPESTLSLVRKLLEERPAAHLGSR